jgi:hypothetical protein
MPGKNDPRWFTLIMASRWPLAVVIAAWSVAVAAIQILRQPIPIGLPLDQPFPVRLVGGVTVDEIKEPVSVKSKGSIAIEASEALPVQGQVSVIKPVLIESNQSLDVQGQVSVNEVTAPVKVQGVDEGPVLVGTSDEDQLTVGGAVEVTEVGGGPINVRLRDAAKSVLPIP